MGRRGHILVGVGLILLGAAITLASYYNAGYTGGRYVITLGLFCVGILRIVRGLFASDGIAAGQTEQSAKKTVVDVRGHGLAP